MARRTVKQPVILVHGGCGVKRPTARQVRIIRLAVRAGYALLQRGAPALDAVEAAVVLLERSGQFNAGKGAKRQQDGIARLDASIMDGRLLSAGAVAGLEGILTPVRVARTVMEQTPHVLIIGVQARKLARRFKIEAYRFPPVTRTRSIQSPSRLGTVGAIAFDCFGHVAAATSTGGIGIMLPGRVGDSPLIGAGTYADDRSGAVSMTGEGEAIVRAGLAKEICVLMEQGASPLQAGRLALRRMRRRVGGYAGGHAGAIILSRTGAFALLHTTPYMVAGFQTDKVGKISWRFQCVK
ncbi:MAG TPA: isoaspartyl peptidase/L-asparaginase family protein [Nitrospiria bacterium]|nr:isoaspartyl peptidase/L-asparaginase family protein [Nitrospiria bacterium]